MLYSLNKALQRIGLRMNLSKMMVMYKDLVVPEQIIVDSTPIEVVKAYTYFRQFMQLGRRNFQKKVARRIQLD